MVIVLKVLGHLYMVCQTALIGLVTVLASEFQVASCLLPFVTTYKDGHVTVLGVQGDLFKDCDLTTGLKVIFWFAAITSLLWLYYLGSRMWRWARSPGGTRAASPGLGA